VTLSVATSIDALAVGLSLRVMELGLWVPCTVIGLCAMAMTALGMTIGKAVGSRVGNAAEALGGVVLLLIGIRLLVSHIQA
jgi:putative Mn2+ efflux pump MntP